MSDLMRDYLVKAHTSMAQISVEKAPCGKETCVGCGRFGSGCIFIEKDSGLDYPINPLDARCKYCALEEKPKWNTVDSKAAENGGVKRCQRCGRHL